MLRIFDANLNRISEGLRVLEEVARFLLDDPDLTEQLKTMRHDLLGSDWSLRRQLLTARKSEEDVGAFVDVSSEVARRNAPDIVMANARRIQESLRVLEEFSKLPSEPRFLSSERIKHARFAIYELERKLVSRLLRRDKLDRLTGLYVIVDSQALKRDTEVEIARKAIRGGARVIQLRDKQRSRGELLPIASELRSLCADSGVLFIVNDYLDLALACDADGVHVGQLDLPVATVRKLLPIDKIAGCSTANVEEALQAQADGADYVAVGSIYPSPSKADTRPAGLETLRQLKSAVSVPVVAIGGINEDNVMAVMEAGADCVAVISAVVGAEDAEAAAHRLACKVDVRKGPGTA